MGPSPSSLGAGEFQEAGCCQECPVAGVILAGGILAFKPRVVQEALDLRQPQPVSRLPEQPRGDSAAAMLLSDMKVADVGPPTLQNSAQRL